MFISCVSVCRTFKRVLAFVCMLSVCCLNVMALSYVGNGCSGLGVAGICALKSVTHGLVLYSLLYGVISVSVDLLVKTFSFLVLIQFSNSCKYACCLAAVSCLKCCVGIVR